MIRALDSLVNRILELFDRRTQSISTIWSRRLPVSPNIELRDLALGRLSKTAILVQGPVYVKPHSTLEICERYCKLYPDSEIVFSTWDSEDISDIRRIKHPNFHLVTSTLPLVPGPSNINLQIASTRAGIKFIESLGVERILKTRSDLYLFSETVLHSCEYFFNKYATATFNRIVVPGFNSFLFKEYALTDQVMYSSAENLAAFWDCEFVSQSRKNFRSEEYLITSFLQRAGINSDITIQRSLEIYRDYFIVLDSSEFNLIWNKGTRREVIGRYQESSFPNLESEICHSIWLRLQDDIEPFICVGKHLREQK